jgi:hypothetical protein
MWVASATMSDLDSERQGHSARLLRALIWGGVCLAPVAAVVVLVGGSGNSVRFGVLLIAVCVMLIGASMVIRNDPVLLRMHVEDRVNDEIDALRERLHEEIAATARATSHRIQALQDELAQARAATPLGAASVGARPGEPGLSTGARAAASASAAVRPVGAGVRAERSGGGGRLPGTVSGSIPAQRGSGVAPPAPQPASGFRSPVAASSEQPHRGAGPRPFPDGIRGTSSDHGTGKRYEADRDSGLGHQGGRGGTPYGSSPRSDAPAADLPSGKRRADVTAIDLGYTGRRARSNHATPDDHTPDEQTGYTGYGAPYPDQSSDRW